MMTDEMSQSAEGTEGAEEPPLPVEEDGTSTENPDDKKVNESKPSNIAVLSGEMEILVDKRIPHLDRGPSLAYATRASGQSHEGCFALVCENHLVPRSADAGKFSGIMSSGLINLVASGVVYWPPAQEERYVFVYESVSAKPIMKNIEEGGLGWKQDAVMNSIVVPMINVLMDLRDVDMVHGAINPMNIFGAGSKDGVDRVMLGECLSTPTSYLQPAMFEPIERAMVDPIAKGPGTSEDDIYAFGVTLVMILRSKDPLAGMSDEDVIRQKIELGSYVSLTGKDRFTGSILELLRGLLYDDRVQRWTLDEVESWLDGQRLSPKQSAKKQKASRPIHFNGERYFRSVLLAMDLEADQSEAMQMIDDGTLEQWISRSLEDNLAGGRLEKALEEAREDGRGPGYWDRLLPRVSVALDVDAPIRFKGMRINPEGFAGALAETYMLKKDLMPFVDIINQQLIMFWLGVQQEGRFDVGNLTSRFDSCRAFLRQNTMGYGVERCLYFLNPECRCISEKLEGYYVRNPEDIMYAFEDIAEKPNRPDLFIDRHIAAFLSVKDRRMIDPFFVELGAEEYHRKILGNIKTLATIQKRSRMEMFPGIAGWIVDILEPVYEHYHDRELQVSIRKKIEKMKEEGDLVKMITLLDKNDIKQRDFLNFRKAMEEYRALGEENLELRKKMENPEIFGKETGQEIAAIVSGVLAGIIILSFAFMHFTEAAIF